MRKISLLFILEFFYSCSTLVHNGTMNQYYFKKNNFSWNAFQSKDFIAYYKTNSQAEKNLPLVEKKIKKGIEQAKKTTNIDSIKTPIYFFIVDDRDDFTKLTGMNHSGVSYARSNTIIESYFLLGQSHEVVHLISYQNWGNSKTWIMEGISVYSDNSWNGKNLEKICLNLYKKKKLIPVKNIIKQRFNRFDSQVIYPQSGSLIKYLIITYGWDKFLHYWKKPNLKKVYNLTESELEENWINYIKNANLAR